MGELSHIDSTGQVRMVDVSAKVPTRRQAVAAATVHCTGAALAAALGESPKGDVFTVAQIAGIMAAKRTPELIPLCHQIQLSNVTVTVTPDNDLPGLRLRATATTTDVTGVEMEALTAVTVAGLTVIDMLKAVDPWMSITEVRLLEKSGGRHGELVRPEGAV